MDKNWYLYILRCGDGTLYTGITTDVEKRLEQHRTGKGAKYTRGRQPLELVYREKCGDHSTALKREYEIKKMPRDAKMRLITKTDEKPALCELAICISRGESG
jgi:predicted GIY-YIG superfamily endonuclease